MKTYSEILQMLDNGSVCNGCDKTHFCDACNLRHKIIELKEIVKKIDEVGVDNVINQLKDNLCIDFNARLAISDIQGYMTGLLLANKSQLPDFIQKDFDLLIKIFEGVKQNEFAS